MENGVKKRRQYLISLGQTRSVVALAASIVVFICTLSAVFDMIAITLETEEDSLHYFTVLSNLLSATGAAFMLPYAVEGIRKKRFVLPRWVVLFQYAGATCVAVTMISALLIITPTQGIKQMMGHNFWLHLVTPVCTVVLFQCVESGIAFTKRDMLLSQAPYWVYMLVYYVMAIVIGKEMGGWSDFYMVQSYLPAWASVLLMLGIGFAVASGLRFVQNRRARQSREHIARGWDEDIEPVELLIETFGLGRYTGGKCGGEELTVPLDVFRMMTERYGIPLEKLTKAYVKGALDALEERDGK